MDFNLSILLFTRAEAAFFREVFGVGFDQHAREGFAAETGVLCDRLVEAGVRQHFGDKDRLEFLRGFTQRLFFAGKRFGCFNALAGSWRI